MKLSKAAFGAAVAALCLALAAPAQANAWKMEPLLAQVSVIQQAQDLQETDRREVTCMALAIYHESRGQPEKGKLAVGHVVLNRTKDSRYPSSVCEVVWQRGQFSWSIRPVGFIVPKDRAEWQSAQELAVRILAGETEDPTSGATHFYNLKTDRPAWSGRGTKTLVVGPHVFIRV